MISTDFNSIGNTIRNIIKDSNRYIEINQNEVIITFGGQTFNITALADPLKKSVSYKKYDYSKDILEKDILLYRFSTKDRNFQLLDCHDKLCKYILDEYYNLDQTQIQHLYDIVILLKLYILINIKEKTGITTSALINKIKGTSYILDQTHPISEIKRDIESIREDNNVIKNRQDRMYEMDKKKALRKTIVDIQEIEIYIVYTIIFVIVILMFFFNLNKEHHDKVKMLVVLCIFMIIVNYGISRIYSVERFSSPSIFKNELEEILKSDKNGKDDTEQFKDFSIKYLNFLKANLRPFDNILSDIDNRMGNEKIKNMYNKEHIKNKYIEQEESYHEMYRDTIYNKDFIYLILFSFIVLILLNSWYLEHYNRSMEDILLFCVFIVLAVSYMVFITKNQYRMRDDSMKYYF